MGRALLPLLLLAACASVPPVPESASLAHPPAPEVIGPHGPLNPAESARVLEMLAAQAPDPAALRRQIALEQSIAETPLYTGNHIELLSDGEQTLPAIFDAIRAARQFVHLEYYILEDVTWNGQRLSDLLIDKRRQGVEIDMIYDAAGSFSTPAEFWDRLRAAGVHVVEFNPLSPLRLPFHHSVNDRDHRKIFVVDGTEAIIGGVNLSSDYESAPQITPSAGQALSGAVHENKEGAAAKKPHEPWHDTDVAIHGPVVLAIDELFRVHWAAQGGEPLEAGKVVKAERAGDEVVRTIGSSPRVLVSRYYVAVLSAIHNAQRSIWVTAAYFVPTEQEKQALKAAAQRGVDVRVLLPSRTDSSAALAVQHSEYTELLRAGVRIYERQGGILHTKAMVIDDVWSIIGSSNFDHRSVLFNDEIDAVTIGEVTAAQFAALFRRNLAQAKPITLPAWEHRGTTERMRERFWRLWEVLL